MAGSRRSPKADILSLCMLVLTATTALPSAVDAADTTTLADSSSSTSTAETLGTTSENQISGTTTTPGTLSSDSSGTETTPTTPTDVQTTPGSVRYLSVTPDNRTLFVGMLAGTPLHVTIAAPNISLLNISAHNASALFKLENGQLLLNDTLWGESTYVVTIATESNQTKLLVRVERLQFDQEIYVTKVPENIQSRRCILDVSSNGERHGAAVRYTLTSAPAPFSMNSSTGELCVEGALDREELSVYWLNVSLQLDQSSLPLQSDQGNMEPDQARTFASVLVRVEDENDNGPSFDNMGQELILSVPESVNDSYVIATLNANDPDEGLNGVIQYSLTNDSSDAFCVRDGQLRVIAPDKLQGQHVFKLTVIATDVNRSSIDSYLDVKIFVVDNIYDFILPSKQPAAILTNNCQYVTEELSNILGLQLTKVRVVEHQQVDSDDSDRSELVFQAFQLGTNDTVHVNTSDIGIKVAGSSERIASLFGRLASVWNSTDVSASSQYTVNSLSKILIAVACLLFVVTLVAVITACRPWKRFSCRRRRDDLSEEASLSLNNWGFSDKPSIKSSRLSEFHEHMETSDFTKTSQPDFNKISESDFTKTSQLEKPLMFEKPDRSFSFHEETHSLGLNTVARREHARDQQMQRMQQLFQAVGSTTLQSKDSSHPKLEPEEKQDSPSNLPGLRSDVSKSTNPSAASIQSPHLGTPQLNPQGSGISTSSPYRSILSKKNDKHEFTATKEHESVQQATIPVLDSVRSSVVLPQIPNSQLIKQHPSFEDGSAPQTLTTDTRVDEQTVTPTHKVDRISGLPLLTPVTPESDQPRLVYHHSASPGSPKEQMEGKADSQRSFSVDSQDLDSFSEDVQHGDVQEEDVQEEDVQDEDVQEGDVQEEDVQDKNVQDEDVQIEDLQDKNVQEEDVQVEDVQEEDVQEEDVQDENVDEVPSPEDAVTHF